MGEPGDGIAATWLPIAETFCCAVLLLLAEAVSSNQPRPVIRVMSSVMWPSRAAIHGGAQSMPRISSYAGLPNATIRASSTSVAVSRSVSTAAATASSSGQP